MIDPDFLGMLVCPATKKPLREASADELAAVNRAIGGGKARNRGGAAVTVAWTAALATTDGSTLYPIQDGIPILLSAEAMLAPFVS
jgi:uncharacterized protein YbaR (Trm112 family)